MYVKLNLKPINTSDVERQVKIWELDAHPTSPGELLTHAGGTSCGRDASRTAAGREAQTS